LDIVFLGAEKKVSRVDAKANIASMANAERRG
jgi:hypothetical protein